MGRCSDARERLLDSASRLIHSRGYSAVSVADICADARLKKGSFYHFFPSKRDLVLATLDRYTAHYVELLRECSDPALGAREKIQCLFARMAEALAEAHRGDGCLRGCPVGNLALEVGDRDDAIRTKLADIFTWWSGALEQWLRQGMADGELDLADPAGVARSLVAYAEGAVLLAKASNDPQLFHQIARGALALIDGAAGRANPRPQTI